MGKYKLQLFERNPRSHFSKFRYFKYTDDDSGRENAWAKLPNIFYWKNAILARKLLRLKYAALPPLRHNSKIFQIRSMIRKSCRRPTVLTPRARSKSNIESVSDEVLTPSGKTRTENWQHFRWKNRILRDACRFEVLEVTENHRVFTVDRSGFKCTSSTLLEAIQNAVHAHDWRLVSKNIEMLSEESKRNISTCYWLLWNGGFLALTNLHKDNTEKVVEFAVHCRCVLKSFPRRLGIEVAAWLSQKGYFLRGLNLLTEWHEQWGKDVCFKRKRYLHNSKRYQVELVATLFHAVSSYVKWKRDLKLQKSEQFTGSTLAIRRTAEFALTHFEEALEYASRAEADVTIFIKPLIELTMELKTEFAARELFLDLLRKYERNFILENLYLDFILDHFGFLNDEIEYFRQMEETRRPSRLVQVQELEKWSTAAK